MLTMYHIVVFQAVLLFRSETWVILATMKKRLDEVHVGFLQHITGKTAQQQWDGMWKREGKECAITETGPWNLGGHMDNQQTIVMDRVALRPIYGVCENDMR